MFQAQSRPLQRFGNWGARERVQGLFHVQSSSNSAMWQPSTPSTSTARLFAAKKSYLDSDLTPQQRELRTKKRDGSQHLKTQGMKPFWREERLFCYIDGSPKENIKPSILW